MIAMQQQTHQEGPGFCAPPPLELPQVGGMAVGSSVPRAAMMHTSGKTGLAARYGESLRAYLAQGRKIISRLQSRHPDALSSPQGKKLLAFIGDGERALGFLPLEEAGQLEQSSVEELEGTCRRLTKAGEALVVAARKRCRIETTGTGAAPSFSGAMDMDDPSPSKRSKFGMGQKASSDSVKAAPWGFHEEGAVLNNPGRVAPSHLSTPISLKKILESQGETIPAEFVCPISDDIMRDPVLLTGDGNTYDRSSCQLVLASGKSPATGQPLQSCSFMAPQHELKKRVADYLESHQKLISTFLAG